LCKELYRRLIEPSDRHLDAVFRTADGARPAADGAFVRRFEDVDPLSAQ
jgi:phenylacetic acid degradation operon negative regulatory protein